MGPPEPGLGGEELKDECGQQTWGLDGALGAGVGGAWGGKQGRWGSVGLKKKKITGIFDPMW